MIKADSLVGTFVGSLETLHIQEFLSNSFLTADKFPYFSWSLISSDTVSNSLAHLEHLSAEGSSQVAVIVS